MKGTWHWLNTQLLVRYFSLYCKNNTHALSHSPARCNRRIGACQLISRKLSFLHLFAHHNLTTLLEG
jgi:hypothetical protein